LSCGLEAPQDTRSKLKLLVRILLAINEVLVHVGKLLLFHTLYLCACTQLRLTNTEALLILLLTQLAQLTGCSQLLLKPLKSKPCSELPRLLAQLCASQTILRP
jgi:hypothetical protein